MLLVAHGEMKETNLASSSAITSQLSNGIQSNNIKNITGSTPHISVYNSTKKRLPFESQQADEKLLADENIENTLVIVCFIFITLFISRCLVTNSNNKYFLNMRAIIGSLTLNWFIPIKASLL